MSNRTSLEKYSPDSPASINVSFRTTTELLRPGCLNISCTEDQCAFNGAVMSTELELLIEKKR